MLYFGLYVQLRRGSVAGYTTDESWAYGPKEGVEAFESITFFIRFIYAINFEHLLITKDGIYDLTFTFNSKTHEVSCDATRKADAIIEKIWSVAGDEGLFETAWDEKSTVNEMEKQENNIYVLVKKGISLNAQTYEYKVCSNHDWTESYGADPLGIGNAILTITEAGTYDVTFTFNQATKEVSATAVPSVTDGISQIASDIKTKKVIYNLQGQRISAPKQGVYIINGKKVVLK